MASVLESSLRLKSSSTRCLRTSRHTMRNARIQEIPITRQFSSSQGRREINKIVSSPEEAIKDIQPKSVMLCGGFGLCGVPNTFIDEIANTPHLTSLIAVSNNAEIPGSGLEKLLGSKQIKKIIASYVGENKVLASIYLNGELEIELTLQGMLV